MIHSSLYSTTFPTFSLSLFLSFTLLFAVPFSNLFSSSSFSRFLTFKLYKYADRRVRKVSRRSRGWVYPLHSFLGTLTQRAKIVSFFYSRRIQLFNIYIKIFFTFRCRRWLFRSDSDVPRIHFNVEKSVAWNEKRFETRTVANFIFTFTWSGF